MTRISALPAESAPTSTDSIPILDQETMTTKRTTLGLLQPYDNPYKFAAYMSATMTTVATTWTKLQMNTEVFDTSNNYSTSTYGFTAPVAGYYSFTVMVQLLSQSGSPFLVSFSKDGTTEFLRGQEIPNTTGNITLSANQIINLNAGEVIYPVYYSGSASKSLQSGAIVSRFSGYLVSRT